MRNYLHGISKKVPLLGKLCDRLLIERSPCFEGCGGQFGLLKRERRSRQGERMKVLEIVTEPLVIHRHEMGIRKDRAGLRTKAVELLGEVGLDASALGRHAHEFTGGQRQRINIARALALRSRLLILDEPVSSLDVSVGAQIVNLLRRLQIEQRLTYLFISHSMPLVRYLSTRIAVMERRRLVETGEAVELCAHPREEYTRQLIAATPELPASVA